MLHSRVFKIIGCVIFRNENGRSPARREPTLSGTARLPHHPDHSNSAQIRQTVSYEFLASRAKMGEHQSPLSLSRDSPSHPQKVPHHSLSSLQRASEESFCLTDSRLSEPGKDTAWARTPRPSPRIRRPRTAPPAGLFKHLLVGS